MATRKVLLVDGQIACQQEFKDKLDARAAGEFDVVGEPSLARAIEYCEKQDVDVVLLDLHLADASGLQAVAKLRERCRNIPIIALASAADTPLAAEAVKAGAQDYLVKDRVCGNMLARSIEYAMERQRLETIAHMAHYDGLTGLATRTLFRDRAQTAIARSKRSQTKLALIYLDLDKFKPINDAYGHDAGDAVLKEVAKRLHESIRATDTAARFGGDEMVVLAESIGSEQDAQAIVDKLRDTLIVPIDVGGESLAVGVSMGIALFPYHGQTMQDLLHHADCAMYESKRRGGEPVFFSPELAGTP